VAGGGRRAAAAMAVMAVMAFIAADIEPALPQ
jgi:hypothetical protein